MPFFEAMVGAELYYSDWGTGAPDEIRPLTAYSTTFG
jgi:hypothetical protein